MDNFCFSVADAHNKVDQAVTMLLTLKKGITSSNYSHLKISVNEHRELSVIQSESETTSFRQTGPDSLIIEINSTINLGKEYSAPPENSPWSSPSRQDIQAIEQNLKKLKVPSIRNRNKIVKAAAGIIARIHPQKKGSCHD